MQLLVDGLCPLFERDVEGAGVGHGHGYGLVADAVAHAVADAVSDAPTPTFSLLRASIAPEYCA